MSATLTIRALPARLEALRPRLPAFLAHLAISGAIFVVLMAMIVFVWYPGPFFTHDGGWRGTLIIVAVDLVLGPVLTLVVYDPVKARWKTVLDLTCIALLQAAALAWGVHVVENQRPVAASFYDGAFQPVTAQRIRQQGEATERVAALGEQRPPLVHVRMPQDPAGRAEMARRLGEDGLPPPVQVQLLEPLTPLHASQLRAATAVVERMARAKPDLAAEIDAFFAGQAGLGREEAYLVPFYGRYGALIFVLDGNLRRVGSLESGFEGIL